MLTPVGKNDERSFDIFCVAECLFFGVVRVKVLALGFQNTQRAALAAKQIIGPPGRSVQFKADLLRVEKIPTAIFQRLVNQDA